MPKKRGNQEEEKGVKIDILLRK